MTLCGLLLYRGIEPGFTGDVSQGFGIHFKGLRQIAIARLPIFGSNANVFHLPATTLILIIIAATRQSFGTNPSTDATCSPWATSEEGRYTV